MQALRQLPDALCRPALAPHAAAIITLLSLNVACLVTYWILYSFFIARALHNLKYLVGSTGGQRKRACAGLARGSQHCVMCSVAAASAAATQMGGGDIGAWRAGCSSRSALFMLSEISSGVVSRAAKMGSERHRHPCWSHRRPLPPHGSSRPSCPSLGAALQRNAHGQPDHPHERKQAVVVGGGAGWGGGGGVVMR